ncbi:hypothetical protein F4810DRAFT_183840 [Camillea tinctor]|nr:hypothetical protein F4810DRAFT_183840 [Camillea tinctor]
MLHRSTWHEDCHIQNLNIVSSCVHVLALAILCYKTKEHVRRARIPFALFLFFFIASFFFISSFPEARLAYHQGLPQVFLLWEGIDYEGILGHSAKPASLCHLLVMCICVITA